MRTDPHMKDRARELRRNITPAEAVLWRHIRGRRFQGWKCRRQHVIGPYIADFYCAKRRLVLELDGDTHVGVEVRDLARQQFIERYGHTVLRFWNSQVFDELDVVLDAIYRACTGEDP